MVSQIPPEQAVHDIPVKTVSGLAIKTVMGNLPALVQMALFPFLLSALITAVTITNFGSPLLIIILFILSFIPHSLFAVAWHRRTLLNLEKSEPTFISSWKKVHWQFLLRVIQLILISYGLLILGSLPALTLGAAIPASLPILFFALFIFIIYVAARLSFILPATAIGEKYTLSNSWKHTDRQGWRLVGTFIIVTTPYALFIIIISQAFESAFISELPSITTNASQVNFENYINDLNQHFLNNGPEIFILNLFIIALTYLPTATTITALSIAFKGCTGWIPEQTEEKVDS